MAQDKAPHIFISCGEASGDRYGGALASALLSQAPGLRISGLGGRQLAAAGVDIVQPVDELAIMGVSEVVRALPAIWRARRQVWRFLEESSVDLVVPIDFPGFNQRLAGKARQLRIPVYWLIAPQVWAWGAWRIPSLRRSLDRLGTVLPFEPEFFGQRGFSVFAMGHPLMEDYGSEEEFQANLQAREGRLEGNHQTLTIGILPGSRRQEVRHLLPILKITGQAVTGHLPGTKVRLIVSSAPDLDAKFCQELFGSEAEVTTEPLPTLLPRIDLALVCSGTASLEATLAGVPHEVVYRTGAVNYWLAKRLVKTEFIGLSNLILNKPVVREHLQGQVAPLPLARSLLRWLARPQERKGFYEAVREVRSLCGPPGVWERTAADVLAHPSLAGSGLEGA